MSAEDRKTRLAEMADKAKAKYADGSLYGTPFNCEDPTHVWALVFALERQLEVARDRVRGSV